MMDIFEQMDREDLRAEAAAFVEDIRAFPRARFSLAILEAMSPTYEEYALLAEHWHLDEDYPDGVPCELACKFILAVNTI